MKCCDLIVNTIIRIGKQSREFELKRINILKGNYAIDESLQSIQIMNDSFKRMNVSHIWKK